VPSELVMPESMPAISDPAERARAAERFIAYAERRAREARTIRDEAVRELRARGRTRPQVAEETGLNVHTVKAILR
jgi:DNA-binding NarL/FixJ family response regulator